MNLPQLMRTILDTPFYLWVFSAGIFIIVLSIIFIIIAFVRNKRSGIVIPKESGSQKTETEVKPEQPQKIAVAQDTRHESITKDQKPAAIEKPVAEPGLMQTKLRLESSISLLKDNFESFHREAIRESDEIIAIILPFFKIVDSIFVREKRTSGYLDVPEKILQYWQNGERDGRLGFILAAYLCARNHEKLNQKLREILTLKTLYEEDRALIMFYFQNELGIAPMKIPENIKARDSLASFLISVRIHNLQPGVFDRKLIKNLELSSPRALSPFYDNLFYPAGNKFVREKYYLEGYQVSDRQKSTLENYFRFGNRKRYLDLSKVPEYDSLFNAWRENPESIPEELVSLVPKGCFKLLLEDFGFSLTENMPKAFIITPTDYREWLWENAFTLPAHYTMRWIKYFISASLWKEFLACTQSKVHLSDYLIRFYRARALFNTGYLHEAWNAIFELWNDYPENLPVMNEAAIYAGKTGKWQKAEEIFTQLKAMYPGHPGVAYNEALLFEQKSESEVHKKWQEVEKLQEHATK